MEKTLTVTIKVEKDENVIINILESESGLNKEIKLNKGFFHDVAINEIGTEIFSWVSIIADEMGNNVEA